MQSELLLLLHVQSSGSELSLRPVFMSQEVFQALFKRIKSHCELNPGHTISVVLHGGEPMLFDPYTLGSWMEAEGEALTKYARFGMQTNASLVSDAWIDA